MARTRKPKDTEAEDLDMEMDEATELSLQEEDPDEETEAKASEEKTKEASEEKEEKPKAKRKPRARKPRARKKTEPVASLLASMSSDETGEDEEETKPEPTLEVEAAVAEDVVVANSSEEEPKKPARRRRAAAEPEMPEEGDSGAIREDVAIASVSIQKTMDTMAKQWGTVKEISSSVCSQLERVNTLLKEVPQQDLFKTPVAKPAPITKLAVGVSAFSVVLSIVSLLLAQSARQKAFDRLGGSAPIAMAAKTAPAPTADEQRSKPAVKFPEPRPESKPIARNTKAAPALTIPWVIAEADREREAQTKTKSRRATKKIKK